MTNLTNQKHNRGWRGLIQEQAGATTTEFAVLLTFITVLSLGLICFLGFETQESLGRFVASWAPDVVQPTVRPHAETANGGDTLTPRGYSEVGRGLRTAGVVGAALLNILLWVLMFRRQQRATRELNAIRGLEDRMPAVSQDVIFEKRQQALKTLATHAAELFDCRLEVRHLMSRHAAAVHPNTPVDDIIDMMHENGFRHLLVTEKDGRLVGIISNRDVRWCGNKTAREVMTANPLTAEASALISTAITVFLKERISCLPVVEDGKLCGVLTTTDLLMAFQCSLQLMQQAANAGALSPTVEENSSAQRISDFVTT